LQTMDDDSYWNQVADSLYDMGEDEEDLLYYDDHAPNHQPIDNYGRDENDAYSNPQPSVVEDGIPAGTPSPLQNSNRSNANGTTSIEPLSEQNDEYCNRSLAPPLQNSNRSSVNSRTSNRPPMQDDGYRNRAVARPPLQKRNRSNSNSATRKETPEEGLNSLRENKSNDESAVKRGARPKPAILSRSNRNRVAQSIRREPKQTHHCHGADCCSIPIMKIFGDDPNTIIIPSHILACDLCPYEMSRYFGPTMLLEERKELEWRVKRQRDLKRKLDRGQRLNESEREFVFGPDCHENALRLFLEMNEEWLVAAEQLEKRVTDIVQKQWMKELDEMKREEMRKVSREEEKKKEEARRKQEAKEREEREKRAREEEKKSDIGSLDKEIRKRQADQAAVRVELKRLRDKLKRVVAKKQRVQARHTAGTASAELQAVVNEEQQIIQERERLQQQLNIHNQRQVQQERLLRAAKDGKLQLARMPSTRHDHSYASKESFHEIMRKFAPSTSSRAPNPTIPTQESLNEQNAPSRATQEAASTSRAIAQPSIRPMAPSAQEPVRHDPTREKPKNTKQMPFSRVPPAPLRRVVVASTAGNSRQQINPSTGLPRPVLKLPTFDAANPSVSHNADRSLSNASDRPTQSTAHKRPAILSKTTVKTIDRAAQSIRLEPKEGSSVYTRPKTDTTAVTRRIQSILYREAPLDPEDPPPPPPLPQPKPKPKHVFWNTPKQHSGPAPSQAAKVVLKVAPSRPASAPAPRVAPAPVRRPPASSSAPVRRPPASSSVPAPAAAPAPAATLAVPRPNGQPPLIMPATLRVFSANEADQAFDNFLMGEDIVTYDDPSPSMASPSVPSSSGPTIDEFLADMPIEDDFPAPPRSTLNLNNFSTSTYECPSPSMESPSFPSSTSSRSIPSIDEVLADMPMEEDFAEPPRGTLTLNNFSTSNPWNSDASQDSNNGQTERSDRNSNT
ncbi:hypothetical protein PFISCL1PPCAC_20994, partial [Pristionchus fissidentatus]